MAFITGSILFDAPASALNNAGAEEGAKTDNVIAVKRILTPEGIFPYISAQAVRFWIRSWLEHNEPNWKAAPVRREGKIAYTDADPLQYWDDDLFGYMRAPSKKTDAARDQNASPLEKDREITRVSPFRVSTFVSVSPTRIVNDFGTMTRQEGDPVPYEHQFYRSHMTGLISLDLSAAGTFFDGARVGYKNLDSYRRDAAREAKLTKVTSRRQTAFRLPLDKRLERVTTLISCLASLSGGAKQAIHYTDLTPAVILLAVTKGGNNPFSRVFTSSTSKMTQFHSAAFSEILETFREEFLSSIYIGWAKGFLDEERAKLDTALNTISDPIITVAHPVSQIREFAKTVGDIRNATWYD